MGMLGNTIQWRSDIHGYSHYTGHNIVARMRDLQEVSLLKYMKIYKKLKFKILKLKLFSRYTGWSESPKSIKVVFPSM